MKHIINFLAEQNVNLDSIHLERRSKDYLSVISNGVWDFCRVKAGPKSTYFTLPFPLNEKKKLLDDLRFVANRNVNDTHGKEAIDMTLEHELKRCRRKTSIDKHTVEKNRRYSRHLYCRQNERRSKK